MQMQLPKRIPANHLQQQLETQKKIETEANSETRATKLRLERKPANDSKNQNAAIQWLKHSS